MTENTNIWLNGIMGVVVGDALGCPVQFETREEVARHPVTGMRGYGTFNLPEGSWTDDSSLTIALLESIRRTGKIDLDDIIAKNQEKAKKKREKMGISENQISNAARMNTRQVTASSKSSVKTTAEKELEIEKANALKANAKPGSMAAKANLVREFNERNNKKN